MATIPATVAEVEADKCYSAPNPPPAPWMADDGWTDIGSVAARFLTAEAVHERAAKSLQLTSWSPKQLEVAPRCGPRGPLTTQATQAETADQPKSVLGSGGHGPQDHGNGLHGNNEGGLPTATRGRNTCWEK